MFFSSSSSSSSSPSSCRSRPFLSLSAFLTYFILMLCTPSPCVAQNQTVGITYTPLKVAVFIDTFNFLPIANSVSNWWVQRIINKGGINGIVPVKVTTYLSGGQATAGWAANITLGMMANGLPDVIVMLCLDTVVPATASLLEPIGVPIIVPMAPASSLYQCGQNYHTQPPCVKPNTRRYQYVHGIAGAAANYFEPFISLLKIKKAGSIAYLQPTAMGGGQSPSFIYQEWADSVKSLAINNKLTMVAIPVRFPAPIAADLPAIAAQLEAANVDALITVTGCEVLLPYFKQVNLNFKAMAMTRCIDTSFPPSTDPGVLSRYVSAPSQWDQRLTGLDYSEYVDSPIEWFPTFDPLNPTNETISPIPSPQQFYNFAVNETGGTMFPDYPTASLAAAFEFIEGGIFNWRVTSEAAAVLLANPFNNATNVTLTVDRPLLNRQLQLLYEPSMFGLLSTNNYGFNQQKELVLLQKTNADTNEITSPLSAATIDFIYPMPTWTERDYIHVMFGTTEEKVICALVVIASVYTLILCIIMCIHRASKQIRASSLTFSLIMAFGGITGYLALLTWPIENNDTTCHARPWLWCLAFQLFFAPLLAKSYRIASIFNVKKFHRAKHDDKLVTWHTFLVALPQLIILMAWSINSPLQVVVRVPDPLRPAYNYADCDSDRATTFVWLSVAYSALCLLAGCLLAYRVRAAFEMFNDARYIANSVYIFTLTAVVIAGVQAGINTATQMHAIFFIRSIGTIVAYGGSVSLLLIPRVIGVLGHSGSAVAGAYEATQMNNQRSGRHDSTGSVEPKQQSGLGPLPMKPLSQQHIHRNSISPSPVTGAHVQVHDKHENDDTLLITGSRRASTSVVSKTTSANASTPTGAQTPHQQIVSPQSSVPNNGLPRRAFH